MNRVLGRYIYIVDLGKIVSRYGGPQSFASFCKDCSFAGIWVRLGHAQDLDPNFSLANLAEIKAALVAEGVTLWGWHVSQCDDLDKAGKEASLVISCSNNNALSGVLLDAEQNDTVENDPEQRYFRGGPKEAEAYASKIQAEAQRQGFGLAFSGQDQPPKHQGFPFDLFLKYCADNCPQVYYGKMTPTQRLNLSVKGYQPLETGRNFLDRYKPVGNITTTSDVALPDEQTCTDYFKEFHGLVATNGYKAYSLWCWDDAPDSIFDTIKKTPGL